MGRARFCPTCGWEMTEEQYRNEGICVTAEDHVKEAQRLVNADPVVDYTQPGASEEWNETYRNNLLASIAHSFVAQNLMDPDLDL